MRYIALFLLLLNLVYFGWNLSRPAPEPVVEPQSRPLLNTGLTLLSEFEADSELQARLNALASRQCSGVSGLSTLDEANEFMAQARAAGLEAALELQGEALESQYRLYLPPASSRSIATITLDGLAERLQQAELEIDSYLITRGLLENAIALGVYEDLSRAQDVRASVAALGYAPEIEEIPRSTGEIRVWLRHPEAERVTEAEWLDLTAERPDLSRSENLCETLVQAPQFQ